MIMKSNYQLTPIEHLENRRPKCKMHTQERQLTCFLYFTTDLQRKPNRLFFSKTEPNLKNPFRTSLMNVDEISVLDGPWDKQQTHTWILGAICILL